MNDWIAIISNVGFPVTITLYLLVRIEAKLEMLTRSIGDLSATIKLIKE
jgi:hypothetical protein